MTSGNHSSWRRGSTHFMRIVFLCISFLQCLFPPLVVHSRGVSLLDCSCPRTFRPVCGTDQQTYDSQCFLDCARRYDRELQLAYEGVCCPKAELCADYLDPVCDQMGNRYDNDCLFEFHKCVQRRSGGKLLRIEGRGDKLCAGKPNVMDKRPHADVVAPPRQCEIFCQEIEAPVCDSQGKTHKNRCKFELASCRMHVRGTVSALHIVSEGPCEHSDGDDEPNRTTQKTPRPANSAALRNRAGLAIALEQLRRDRAMKRLNLPVQGNGEGDGRKRERTNTSERGEPHPQRGGGDVALMNERHAAERTAETEQNHPHNEGKWKTAATVRAGKQQTSSASGKGGECDLCRDEGPFDQIVPVCDNTNLTHQSVCLFAQWNCEKRARGTEEHVLAHVGECSVVSPIFELKDEVCPAKCSHHYKPVCDSNGLSHPNLCAYQMHSCHQRRAGRKFGWLVSLHECTNSTSTMDRPDNQDKEKPSTIECPQEPECGQQEQDGPICDSDGRIHKSTCLFAHEHCLAAKEGKVLRIVEDERCEEMEKIAEEKSEKGATEECGSIMCNAHGAAEPYCGTDFVTYKNICKLQMAQCLDNGVEVLFKGECEQCLHSPCPQLSPAQINNDALFVCDQSGDTKTRCEFEMLRCIYEAKFGYNITAAYDGKCCPSVEQCPLHSHHWPQSASAVCDSAGGRHRSRCAFEVARCRAKKIAKRTLEERYCPMMELQQQQQRGGQRGPEGRQGKRGRNGKNGGDGMVMAWTGNMQTATTDAATTLNYDSLFQQKSIDVESSTIRQASGGPDLPKQEAAMMNVSVDLLSVENLICGEKYEPVCGSDQRTYRNACNLERRNASHSSDEGGRTTKLQVLYPGECCPQVDCPGEYAPICDNEGVTHLNFCEFGRQRCLAERQREHNLTIAAYSLCPSLQCPRAVCPTVYEPVCGTNGRTYANLCELDKIVCVLRSGMNRQQNGTIEQRKQIMLGLDYIGECCESAVECTDLELHLGGPVCDNKGRTHRHECAFRRAACTARHREQLVLRVDKKGECQRNGSERRHKRESIGLV